MRTEIAHLEKKTVWASGRVIKKINRDDLDDTVDVLLSPVKLYVWDEFSAFNPKTATVSAQTDHIWIRMPRSESTRIEMWMECCCAGRVSYYTRSKGSVDLTVNTQPSVSLDQIMQESRATFTNYDKEGTSALRRAIEDLDYGLSAVFHQGDGGYAFSSYYNLEKATKSMIRVRAKLQRCADAIDMRMATATSNGTCTPLRDTLRLPSCKRQRSVGFA